MIRELQNLKVRTLACDIDEYTYDMRLERKVERHESYPVIVYMPNPEYDEPPYFIKLPEGQWKILGRVNELKEREMLTLYYGTDWMFDDSPIYDRMDITWDIYCHENNLTNELILIEQL